MKEQILVTSIGEEVSVSVFFDYEPEELETQTDPGWPSKVIINKVCIGDGTDVVDCLNESTIATLCSECEQMLIDEAEDEA